MKMIKAALMATLILAPSLSGAAGPAPKIALLPFMPHGGADPKEGWSLAVKYLSHVPPHMKVQTVNWKDLGELMDQEKIDRGQLRRLQTLRRLGQALGVDAVVTGEFVAQGQDRLARPLLVQVASGQVKRGKAWKITQDLVVPPVEMPVEAPVIDEEEALSMRDGPSEDGYCAGATDRVDELERRIIDLKARYWALQLSRRVAMKGIKFNPGSTITDPALKKEFYGRMKEWYKQDIIPELTPHESAQFAAADAKAVAIARRCGIM